MKTLITIIFRSGSKRLPGKNVREFCGSPLFHHTVSQAGLFICPRADKEDRLEDFDILLCTDYKELPGPFTLEELPENVRVVDRPETLNGDDVPKLKVIRYATKQAENIFGCRYGAVIDLDVTNPLRKKDDIEKAFNLFLKDDRNVVISVTKARRNPSFNMVVEEVESGWLDTPVDFISKDDPVYDLNAAIYIYPRTYLDLNFDTPINPYANLYLMEDWQAFDIDTETDWEIAEYLYQLHIEDVLIEL